MSRINDRRKARPDYDMTAVFRGIPDIAVITDAYGYILDYNIAASDLKLKKGRNIERYLPGCIAEGNGTTELADRVYKRTVSAIMDKDAVTGYTVSLVDITDITRIIHAREEKSKEMLALVDELIRQNVELERYVLQARELTDYSEQLAIARKIHDDEGHAITAIHSISEMCLKLKDTDSGEYDRLIAEGIDICRNALSGSGGPQYDSLGELFEGFLRVSRFPVEVSVEGSEPAFLKDIYPYVGRVCKEAYHNTLSHSLADKLFINVNMDDTSFTIRIQDNGSFRGKFEKGFGLTTMEDYVQSTGGTLEFITNEGEGFGLIATWRGYNGQDKGDHCG